MPPDDGRSGVDQLLAERGLAPPGPEQSENSKTVATFTQQALEKPLTAELAVQLAWLNNPDLRKEFAQLGFSAAELYDAGRLANPVLSAVRLSPGDPAAANAQLSLGIAVSFTDLLLRPAHRRFSAAQFAATQLAVGDAALRFAAAVKTAWYDAVIAGQQAQLWEESAGSAAASAALAQRYFDAGNISQRTLAMEKAAAGSAQAAALLARSDANAARSQLNRLMGLSAGQNTWQLDPHLALPPEAIPPLDALLQQAAKQRLDIASAERRTRAFAQRHGLARKTRFIGGIEIGYVREKDFDGFVNKGPSLGLELPLFNRSGRIRAARAALALEETQLDHAVLSASNEVQGAWDALNAAKERVDLYRQTIIPQRANVVARMQEELGYMLIGVFEVITAKQAEYQAHAEYLDALGDYWRARIELARAAGGRLPDDV
ncbi:MAG: TolC family protein [Pseudomonadota bacterium]